MPTITISHTTYDKLTNFKKIYDSVMEQELENNAYIESIILHGIESLINNLFGNKDVSDLRDVIRKMMLDSPDHPCSLITDEEKRQLGFRTPEKT